MPLYSLNELLSAHPTPLISQAAFDSTSDWQQSDASDCEDVPFEETRLDAYVMEFGFVAGSTFLQISYDDYDSTESLEIETIAHRYLGPILACANGSRLPGSPFVTLGKGLSYNGLACFEFKLEELPFPQHPKKLPPDSLPIVAFMPPGALDIQKWTGDSVRNTGRIQATTIAKHYAGQFVIFTDTLTVVALRYMQPPWDPKLRYAPFTDLQSKPFRLIVATFLFMQLRDEAFRQAASFTLGDMQPFGALPEHRGMTYEDALAQWKQKSDIDWYTACHDAEYQAIVSRWIQDMLNAHQGQKFVARGDTLKIAPFAYQRRFPPLEAVYPKKPLPDSTASLLEEKRPNRLLEELGSMLDSAEEAEIRILEEVDSSNSLDGTSFVCEIITIDGNSVSTGSRLSVKIFDDRRMGDLEWDSGDDEWFSDSVWTQSDILVSLEEAAYRRLDHAQGSMIPYYYGAHEVVLPDGTRCWAILTELVEGYNPQSLPKGVEDRIKGDVVSYLRHFLRVLEYSDMTKAMWRFGDIRIQLPSGESHDRASSRPVCTIVSLWRTEFSTPDGPVEQCDDHAQLETMMSIAFGEGIARERFACREPWDYFLEPTNQYIGLEWKPADWDERYFIVDEFPRRSM